MGAPKLVSSVRTLNFLLQKVETIPTSFLRILKKYTVRVNVFINAKELDKCERFLRCTWRGPDTHWPQVTLCSNSP